MGRYRPLTVLLEPSDSKPSTTTSSLPPKDSGSKEDSEKDDDRILLEEIVLLHGRRPTRNTLRRCHTDLREFRILGIDPHRNLLPAIQLALINAGKKGAVVLDPTTSLVGRFEIPAAEMKENFSVQSTREVQHWLDLFAKESTAVIARRKPPAGIGGGISRGVHPGKPASKPHFQRREF